MKFKHFTENAKLNLTFVGWNGSLNFSRLLRLLSVEFKKRRRPRQRQRHKSSNIIGWKNQNDRAARAARIFVHFSPVLVKTIESLRKDDDFDFSAILHKTTTWNHQILGFDDNVSI